ncbi:hypothetical protein K432DRAFT_228504 [Lepidopterella palustris CBS 459.81]|uniref:Uncharacterized protein n=1 Tax=Lepidopterella palustris CBS 459.81 TaxID=1314670 RepID=A0A8E2EL16_9PEZI|nr:hypothetical protein K432DRAFT_228504 [Lepidopterella palustris CBS 459.81]
MPVMTLRSVSQGSQHSSSHRESVSAVSKHSFTYITPSSGFTSASPPQPQSLTDASLSATKASDTGLASWISVPRRRLSTAGTVDTAGTTGTACTAVTTALENSRPRPLLSKSSSAVPTLSTTSTLASPSRSGTATPTTAQRPLPGGASSTTMTAHGGVNPHTAADLLRQAMMQSVRGKGGQS